MLRSLDPFRLSLLSTYDNESSQAIATKIDLAEKTFQSWRFSPIEKRQLLLNKMAALFLERKTELAELMAREMGKPITQGLAEIEKCASACRYYSDSAPAFLDDVVVETDARLSVVRKSALGVWLGIMPWNFPFWQVVRCAIPAVLAGNTFLLKHASNVSGCALALEQLLRDAGAKKGVFQVLLISSSQVEDVLRHQAVRGISLTGSESAGRQVAAAAGRQIKPVVLELGGSNAFIVLPDADLEWAAEQALLGRFLNNGQSCIAAKRFLIHENIHDAFVELFHEKIKAIVQGDPLDAESFMSVLAHTEAAENIHYTVTQAAQQGAKVLCGGTFHHAAYAPTLLTGVNASMQCMQEEVFGPVAPVMKVASLEEAIAVSNSSRFGLGVSVFTQDLTALFKKIDQFDEGAVFVNAFVKSDPRLPFGGIKSSGFGRELSSEGMNEFVNIKTLYIG
jgi:succinate-semialdehyde dehydrogenase/glutarate-semialdehyde dehydrogenase